MRLALAWALLIKVPSQRLPKGAKLARRSLQRNPRGPIPPRRLLPSFLSIENDESQYVKLGDFS